MPVEDRATDTYTQDNLLLGFSQVTFTPSLAGGGYGTPVPLGILSGEELQKSIELRQLERGDSGLIVIDRELVSKLELSLQLTTFNFRYDLAKYIFASSSVDTVVADAAAVVSDDPVTIPTADSFDTFLALSRGNVTEASVAITFAPIVAEAVGTGNGVLGATQGDFGLNQKIKAIADVLFFYIDGVDYGPSGLNKLVAGSSATADQIAIEIGEEDSLTAGSGAITLGSNFAPVASGEAIVATYTPSFSGADIALNTDFRVDPVSGRVRLLHAASNASPFRLAASAGGTQLLVDYTYARAASHTIYPFTQTSGFSGKAQIKHLTDVGINFIWDIPSASIRITDDALTFDASDFASGVLILNVLNAGGSAPYGTFAISSEPEQLA